MSANPLEPDPDRERRIRERAYHLWNDEGQPHGRDPEFWERASELIGMEDSAGSGQLPNPQSSGQDPLREQPVEEAFIEENLGEFPSRFTDQGETQPTPKAKRDPVVPAKATAKTPAKTQATPKTVEKPAEVPTKKKPTKSKKT